MKQICLVSIEQIIVGHEILLADANSLDSDQNMVTYDFMNSCIVKSSPLPKHLQKHNYFFTSTQLHSVLYTRMLSLLIINNHTLHLAELQHLLEHIRTTSGIALHSDVIDYNTTNLLSISQGYDAIMLT